MWAKAKLLFAFVHPFSVPPVTNQVPESTTHGESGPGSMPRVKSSEKSWASATEAQTHRNKAKRILMPGDARIDATRANSYRFSSWTRCCVTREPGHSRLRPIRSNHPLSYGGLQCLPIF